EMSPATQVKLLRVLQEREAIPVGGTEAIPVDVRVVAATNRDLEEDIKRGRFRTDLYYRLNVIAIHLPPLRERRDDIQILWEEFLSRIAKEREEQPKALAQDAKDALPAYDWPGSARARRAGALGAGRRAPRSRRRRGGGRRGGTRPRLGFPRSGDHRRPEPRVQRARGGRRLVRAGAVRPLPVVRPRLDAARPDGAVPAHGLGAGGGL